MLSISVDSTKPDDHDTFRKHKGAFTKATSALKMIAYRESKKLIPSMKTVVMPDTIDEMSAQAALADQLGCKRELYISNLFPVKQKSITECG